MVIAARQSHGRGRLGRAWHSPAGNLYLSILLRPQRPASELGSLALVVGLALLEALEQSSASKLDLALKWPNDLLLGGAKLAGILLEHETVGSSAPYIVLGCGVNLEHHPELPSYPATSLRAHGIRTDRRTVTIAFLGSFERYYAQWLAVGFSPLRLEWLRRAWRHREELQLMNGSNQVRGVFSEVDEDGALILQTELGLRRFLAGEIVSVPLAGQS